MSHAAVDNGTAGQRFDRLDALRGLAIVWMIGFHFGFDLNHLGWITPRQSFHRDPFWTTQRTLIVSLFLLCAGLVRRWPGRPARAGRAFGGVGVRWRLVPCWCRQVRR